MVATDAIQAVVERLAERLERQYVFPDKGQQMAVLLRDKLHQGDYRDIGEPDALARSLTHDVHNVCEDLHLLVEYNPELAATIADLKDGPAAMPVEQLEDYGISLWAPWAHHENYGFERVERLPGNIGYLDLRMFAPSQVAGDIAVHALNFLAHCKALIFDLRQNGGGDPGGMNQLLSSYLFDREPRQLNSFYWRPTDETTQTWTLPYIPGKRFPTAPVYVLISAFTFSAAEIFAYNLKAMGRATIVGERTGGGANPVDAYVLGEGFIVRVPEGQTINPITKTNWEGTGVEPDIAVPAERALETAHLHALDTLKAQTANDADRAFYEWETDAARARYQPPTSEDRARLAGTYGHLTLIEDSGHLYQQVSRTRRKLLAFGGNRYGMGSGTKLTFDIDSTGNVTGVNVLNRASGQTSYLTRSS